MGTPSATALPGRGGKRRSGACGGFTDTQQGARGSGAPDRDILRRGPGAGTPTPYAAGEAVAVERLTGPRPRVRLIEDCRAGRSGVGPVCGTASSQRACRGRTSRCVGRTAPAATTGVTESDRPSSPCFPTHRSDSEGTGSTSGCTGRLSAVAGQLEGVRSGGWDTGSAAAGGALDPVPSSPSPAGAAPGRRPVPR